MLRGARLNLVEGTGRTMIQFLIQELLRFTVQSHVRPEKPKKKGVVGVREEKYRRSSPGFLKRLTSFSSLTEPLIRHSSLVIIVFFPNRTSP